MATIRTLFWIMGVTILITGCRHGRPDSPLEITNSALHQLFDGRCESCPKTDGFVAESHKRFVSGKIDSAAYFAILDSLETSDGKSKKTCFLQYTEDSDIFYRKNSSTDSSLRESAMIIIKSSKILVDFPTLTLEGLLDSISTRPGYKASDFHQQCFEVVPYTANPDYPFEDGIGVLTFSKIIFDESRQRAILYYEFMCSRSCGRGEIVTMRLSGNDWEIVRREIVWQV